VPDLVTPYVNKGDVFHQYTIRILEGKRDRVQSSLKEQGIGTMIYYPVSQDQLPVYAGNYDKLPMSELLSEQVLSLPIWPELTAEKIKTITQAVIKSL
jgi:dTDP-4-amino-4,6-dideoxygalactose transaminase